MNIDDIIFHYKISDEEEITSIRLLNYFCDYSNKNSISFIKFPKRDPRKSYLFKICYKMLQEIKEKLKENEYMLFVRAQVDVIHNIAAINNIPYNANPQSLLGEKAFRRWHYWKKIYNNKLQLKEAKEAGVDIHEFNHVRYILLETKKILENKLGTITKDKIQKIISNRVIYRWFNLGIISGYFLLLVGASDMDLSLYADGITDEVKTFFTEEYDLE